VSQVIGLEEQVLAIGKWYRRL